MLRSINIFLVALKCTILLRIFFPLLPLMMIESCSCSVNKSIFGFAPPLQRLGGYNCAFKNGKP